MNSVITYDDSEREDESTPILLRIRPTASSNEKYKELDKDFLWLEYARFIL